VVPGRLHGAIQPATQALWTPVQRALQGPGGGRLGQRLPEDGVRLRPSESGAGEVTERQGIVEGIRVEQLSELSQSAGEAAGVAASESVAGRTRHTQRQRGWARAVRSSDAASACSRGRAGISGDPTRPVFWGEGVSEGVARAGGRTGGRIPLRGGTAGERRGEGAGDRGGGIEAARVDGGGPEGSAKRRCKEGAHCAAAADGDDDDAEIDRGGVADGDLDTRVEFAIQAAAEKVAVR